MRAFVLILFLTTAFSLCKKKDFIEIPPPVFNLQDSAFHIKNVWWADLNEFYVQYYINTKDFNITTYGLAYKIDSANATVNKISLGTTFQGIVNQTYVLTGLKPDVYYLLRIYAVKDRDTIYSAEVKRRTWNLVLVGDLRPKFARPMLNAVQTNLFDSVYGVNSRVWIGSTECAVTQESSSMILFNTPDNLPYGYHRLKIQRKGLELNVDSVYVFLGKWNELGEFPVKDNTSFGGPNYFLKYGTFNRNGKGYLFGGLYWEYFFNSNGQAYSRADFFLEYDYPSNSWTEIPYSISTYFDDPLTVTINDETYIVGGEIDTTNTNGSHLPLTHVYKFNFTARKWDKLGPLPWPSWKYRSGSLAFTYNEKIYTTLGRYSVLNGLDSAANDLWEYNPKSGQWVQKSDFPSFPRMSASVFVIDGKAYIIGGMRMSQPYELTNELWVYNISADTWSKINYINAPPPIVKPATFSYNGKGYLINPWYKSPYGVGYSTHLSLEFNPATNTMTQILGGPKNVTGGVLLQIGNKFIFTGRELLGVLETMSKSVSEFKVE